MNINECSIGDTVLIPFTEYFYCCIILDSDIVQHINGDREKLVNYNVRKISEKRFLEIEKKEYVEKTLLTEDFRKEYISLED